MTTSTTLGVCPPLCVILLLALGSFVTGCGVPTDLHDAVLADLETSRRALDDCQTNRLALTASVSTLRGSHAECQAELTSLEERLATSSSEAQRRDAIYQQLVGRLQGMIDGGQLEVVVEDGLIVLVLPNDVLFESGRTELEELGRITLSGVAVALGGLTDQRFQVQGHTDNVPISNQHFASNWDLSTARAVTVVRLLVEEGVDPHNLSAAGFGEFSPSSPNDTASQRAQNRRIKIVLVPDLGAIPEAHAGGR